MKQSDPYRSAAFSSMVVAVLLTIGLSASPAPAVVYTVGPSGSYSNIQGAINAAVAGQTTDIRVQAGVTYNENLLVPVSFDEAVIVLTGGWNSFFTVRDTDPESTVIDGGGGRVLEVRLTGVSFTIDGFTLTNGGAERGAGVYILLNGNADVFIENVRIVGNTATSSGQATGGGIRAELDGTEYLELRDCRIRDNQAISTGGAQAIGGGLSISAVGDSSFLVQSCEIDRNTIESSGGALYGGGVALLLNVNAQGELLDSYPVDNTALGTNEYASGALFEVRGGASLTVERCGFALNEFGAGGLGPQVRALADNTATFLMRDSGVGHGDHVGLTGYAYGTATLNLVNLTVADEPTNGIYLSQSDSSVLTLYNSLVYNSGNNLVTIGAVDMGSNMVGGDPLFVDPANLDYHLRPGSPAINAGDNSPPGGLGATDFDGNPRILDGIVDLGMFEGATFLIFADGFDSGDTSAWSKSVP